MPELPEVETVRRGLMPVMVGAQIDKVELRRPDIRFPFPASFERRLTGRRILDVSRRAKYLLFSLDKGETLIAHLGMSGSFRIEEAGGFITPGEFVYERSKDPKHDHVVVTLDNGCRRHLQRPATVRLHGFLAASGGARRPPAAERARRRTAGAGIRRPFLAKLFAGARTSLKAGLLDQKRIAGLGNIYACEALFRARLAPTREAGILGGHPRRPHPRRGRRRRGDPQRARGSDRSGRLHPARSPADKRRIGIFSAHLQSLRPRGTAVREGALSRGRRQDRALGRSTFYCAICQRAAGRRKARALDH